MWIEKDGYKEEALIGDGIEHNGKLWCLCSNFNRMYCIDIAEGIVEKRIILENNYNSGIHLYSKILCISDSLYLIPFHSKMLVKYHIYSGEIQYIDFSNFCEESVNGELFITGCCYKQYIFMFPYRYGNILRFDTKNNQIDFLELPNRIDNKYSKRSFVRRSIVEKKHIWIAEDRGNLILQINVENMQGTWIEFPDHLHIRDISLCNEEMLCLDISGKVIVYNIKTKANSIIFDVESSQYGFVEKSKDSIWLIPSNTNSIIRYTKEGQIKEIKYPDNFIFSKNIINNCRRTFSNVYCNKSKMVIMPRCNNVLIEIDKIRDEIIFKKINFSKEVKEKMKESFYQEIEKNYFVTEQQGRIEWFIDSLDGNISINPINKKNKGKLIFQMITNR